MSAEITAIDREIFAAVNRRLDAVARLKRHKDEHGLAFVDPNREAAMFAERRPDRDFAIMLSEWRIVPGTRRPDPNTMTDFNVLTMNARCFPGTFTLAFCT